MIVLATRKSPLALWQAHHVAALWAEHYPTHPVSFLEMNTAGDRFLEQRLQALGGKGLFVKELQAAMLRGEADASVHSLKDVPMQLPVELALAAYLPRASPRDAVVCHHAEYQSLDDLPHGARIGTSSLRREAQLRRAYPHLHMESVRGNVGTRLSKLEAGQFDALILAEAGLERLGLQHRIAFVLSEELSLPAAGQGILAVEVPIKHPLFSAWHALNHAPTAYCARAERALSGRLGGSCHIPLAAYATFNHERQSLQLRARVLSQDGSQCFEAEAEGLCQAPEDLGIQVAEALLLQGAAICLPDLPA